MDDDEFHLLKRRAALLELSLSDYLRYATLGMLPYWPPTPNEIRLSRQNIIAHDDTRSAGFAYNFSRTIFHLKTALAALARPEHALSFLETYASLDDTTIEDKWYNFLFKDSAAAEDSPPTADV
jgi:hypothetical protein